MKTAKYRTADGKEIAIEYDENAPCLSCGLPVIEASMGQTAICPWCDCGAYRNGKKWDLQDEVWPELRRERAKRAVEKMRDPGLRVKDAGGPNDGEPTTSMERILNNFPSPQVCELMRFSGGDP